MSDSSFPWLDEALGGSDPGPDPWGDVDVEPVDLTADQHDFLASFAAQPAVPRLRRLADPLAAFEAADDDDRTGNAPDDTSGPFT